MLTETSIKSCMCHEAAGWLAQGIATTRAGSIVTSDTMIVRDPLYTGNQIEERASTVLRMAPSFFRFGSFEIFNHTDTKTGRPCKRRALEYSHVT